MVVKELSVKTGINKYTLDNYLSRHGCIPPADVAVKIAQVLGVSVEYLITGCEVVCEKTLASLPPDVRSFIHVIDQLEEYDRKIVLKTAIHLAEAMNRREKEVDIERTLLKHRKT
ncbi:MAG: helix-turn-helix transcriptional regulator [Treponema sp.]|nr:helix-turn-helix transcriptional regulator [Treponema sp.]